MEMSEQNTQIEQIDDQAIMPIMVERENLRIRIRNNILKVLLCDINKLSATVILELQRDLEEWGKCPSVN